MARGHVGSEELRPELIMAQTHRYAGLSEDLDMRYGGVERRLFELRVERYVYHVLFFTSVILFIMFSM